MDRASKASVNVCAAPSNEVGPPPVDPELELVGRAALRHESIKVRFNDGA